MVRTQAIIVAAGLALSLGAAGGGRMAAMAEDQSTMDANQIGDHLGSLPGWRRVAGPESDALTERLAGLNFWQAGRAADIRSIPLPFYKAFALYEATSADGLPPMVVRFLRHGDEIFVLDGSAGPVHAVNQREVLHLTADGVADYVRFFFANVRGSGDGFRVVERVEDVPFHGDASEEQRRRVADLVTPLSVVGNLPQGFAADGTVLFQSGLFSAKFVISPDGDVTTLGEKLLMDKVPAFARIPLW